MKIKYLLTGAIIAILLSVMPDMVQAQKEGDRIIAVVGNDIILESDLQYQVQMYMRQNQMTEITDAMVQQIFQSMVNERIITAKADQDSIIIKPEEINKELDYRIKSLLEQLGSEDKIEQAYGMTMGKIRILLKEDLEKKMKSDRLKRKKFPNGIKATDKEVRDFFEQYRDSLPEASTEYELSHIYVVRTVTDDEKKLAFEKAKIILDSIKNGANFEELAKRNSDDVQSAKQGGDLGFARKGMFVKEFEEVLFNLNPGEISDVVETEYGYHIIKATDKRADQIRSSHILVMYPKLESNDFGTISKLKGIKSDIEAGKITFEDAAKKYSQEKETSDKGGYLGFVPIEKLDSNVVAELKLLSPGQISDPIRVGDSRNYGYELMKIISIRPSHKLSLDTDYDRIKRYAEFFKENSEMDKWMQEIRRTIFIDIKM